ncbi:VOC family protein [Actinocrispum wychmicini]|uniref:Biphenyl-2,3-diol 1,2-dioxygenase n=1 Tax=Actinocrispum wychmicini TaxID=1213861 RepID=A0A4R2JSQ8_9PSEU|nr:VOC family protein [Actinocrispum wychmicini]TCO59919.1 biphenyl-2,3-diol 1,2-dioxygenase [Actinocrispum wychmicini]
MLIRSLAYVGLTTRDLAGWESFAGEVLGLPADRAGDRLLLRMDERIYRFDLRQGEREELAWLGWEVASAADLAEVERSLTAAGLPVHRADDAECADRRLIGMISVRDPAGVRHEIGYGQEADFRPLRLTRPLSGYLTGGFGMGHAVIGVKEYDETLAFLVDGLGFRISDTFGGFIAFLHCNPRHHSIALVHTDEPGLRHIMLETTGLDDVGATIDVCLSRGIVTRTLGRHTNDRAVSFYLSTPSGWEIEYGWGGIEVDSADHSARQLVGPTSLWGHQHLVDNEIRSS